MEDRGRFFNWHYVQGFVNDELTTYPDKAELYSIEASFRDSLYYAATSLGDGQLGTEIRGVGLALFRPDAIAHGKVKDALDYYARLGVRPRYCAEVGVSPAAVREIWRYQFNVASAQRIRLLDLVFGAMPSIVALFDVEDAPVPCAALMADAKGEADPRIRAGWELRSYLESPHRIEVYVHVADEPVDVVRDGGILLGPRRFGEAIMAGGAVDVTDDIVDLADRLSRQYGGNSNVVVSDELLRAELAAAGYTPGALVNRWQVLRDLGGRCEMFAGPGENIVCHSGTDSWWDRAGLLEQRTEYLAGRLGHSPSKAAS